MSREDGIVSEIIASLLYEEVLSTYEKQSLRSALGLDTGDSPTFTNLTVSSLDSSGAITTTAQSRIGDLQLQTAVSGATALVSLSGALALRGSGIRFGDNATPYAQFATGGGFQIKSGLPIGWSTSTTTANTSGYNVSLFDEGDGILAQRNGTTGQIFRSYNSFVSTTSFERATFGWVSGSFRIGTEFAGSGTAKGLDIITGGESRINLDTLGNVGINGSPPSNHSGGSTHRGIWLGASDSGILYETASTTKSIALGTNVVRSGGLWVKQDNTFGSYFLQLGHRSASDGLNLSHATAGATNYLENIFSVNATRMYVKGNLGVGAITPDSKIHVVAPSGGVGRIGWDNGQISGFSFFAPDNGLYDGDVSLYVDPEQGVMFGVGNTVVSTTDAKVAIDGIVEIQKPVTTALLKLAYNGTYYSSLNYLGSIDVNTDVATDLWQVKRNGTAQLSINGNGKVGIGTASPLNILHVKNSAEDGGVMLENAHNYGGFINIFQNSASGGHVSGIKWTGKDNSSTSAYAQIDASYGSGYTNAYMSFRVGDEAGALQQRLIIDKYGNIGVGTSDPKTKLHLSGGIGTALRLSNTNVPSRGNFFWAAGISGYSNESAAFYENYDSVDVYHIATFQKSFFLGGRNNATSLASVTILNEQAKSQIFRADSTAPFTILSGGDVGVGKVDPTARLDVAATWNTSGTTFTGARINITDTASAADSKFLDLQVAGDSKTQILKTGEIRFKSRYGGISAAPIRIIPDSTTYNELTFLGGNGGGQFVFASADLNWNVVMGMGVGLGFTGSWPNQSPDLLLVRDEANILAQRRGVNPQSFRLYNTYTSSTNFERGYLRWSTNVFEIGTDQSGDGASRSLLLASSLNLNLEANNNGNINIKTNANNGNITFSNYSAGTYFTSRDITTGVTRNLITFTNDSNEFRFQSRLNSSTNHEFFMVTTGSYTKKLNIGGSAQAGGQAGTDLVLFSGPQGSSSVRSGDIYLQAAGTTGTGRAGAVIIQNDGTNSLSGGVSIGKALPSARLDIEETWNNAGTSFTGIRYNAVDTASDAGSRLLDLQTGGDSKFYVGKEGNVIASGSFVVPVLQVSGYVSGTMSIGGWFNLTGTSATAGINFGSGNLLRWGSASTNGEQTGDVGIGRNTTGVVEINSGTAGAYRDLIARDIESTGLIKVRPPESGGGANAALHLVSRHGGVETPVIFYSNWTGGLIITPTQNQTKLAGGLALGTYSINDAPTGGGLVMPGSLGIGTNDPYYPLHVQKTSLATLAQFHNYDGTNGQTRDYVVKIISNGGNANGINQGLYVEATNASVNYALHVVGRSSFNGDVSFNGNALTEVGNTVMGGANNTTNGTLRLFTTNAGVANYGQGVGGTLVLAGDTGEPGGGGRAVFGFVKGVKETNGYLNSLGALSFGTQSTATDLAGLATVTEKMRITSEGKVGIGKNNPGTALDVVGTITSTGLQVNGDAAVSNILSSAKYHLGTDVGIFPVAGGQSTIQSHWGLKLVGNSMETPQNYTPTNTGNAGDFSVMIPNQQASKIGLVVRGASGQTGDLVQWQNDSGTILGRIDSAGKLGIGSTPPATALDVAGTITATGANIAGNITLSNSGYLLMEPTGAHYIAARPAASAFSINSANYFNFSKAGTVHARIADGTGGAFTYFSGNVGIGNANPSEKLEVVGNILLKNGTTSTGISIYNTFTNTSNYELGELKWIANTLTLLTSAESGVERAIGLQGSAVNLVATTNGIITASTNGEERFRIKADGKVGIGTTNPGEMLTLGSGGKVKLVDSTGTYGTVIYNDAYTFTIAGTTPNYTDRISILDNIYMWGGSRIHGNGSQLISNRDIYVPHTGGFGFETYSATVPWLFLTSLYTDNNNGGFALHTRSAGSNVERMRFTSGGDIGIGTDAPRGKLDVRATDNTSTAAFTLSRSSDSSQDVRMWNDGNGFRINSHVTADFGLWGGGVVNSWGIRGRIGDQYLHFYAPDSIRMTIDGTNGFVGVGSATPSAKFHVKGNATGDIFKVTSSTDTSLVNLTTDGTLVIGNGTRTASTTFDVIARGDSDGIRLYSLNNTAGGSVNPPSIGFYRSIGSPSSSSRFKIQGSAAGADYDGFVFSSPNSSINWIAGSVGGGAGLPETLAPDTANTISFCQQSYFTNGTIVLGKDTVASSMPTDGYVRSGQKNNAVTDVQGSNLYFQAGRGTGNSTSGGNLYFQTPDATTSGTTAQAYTTKFSILRSGFVGVGITPTNKFTVGGTYAEQAFVVKNGSVTSFSVTNNGGAANSNVFNGTFTLRGDSYWLESNRGTYSLPAVDQFRFSAASFNTGAKLQLMTNHGSEVSGFHAIEFLSNNGGAAQSTTGSVNASIQNNLDGTIRFSTAESISTSGTSTNLREVARISADGYLGIGTNNPSYKLHVVGTTYLSQTLVTGGSAQIGATNGYLAVGTSGNGEIVLANGGAGAFTITGSGSTGNVVINNSNTVGGNIDIQSRGTTMIGITPTAVNLNNGLIFDRDGSTTRIFSDGTINYQSNNATLQHRITNQVGTSLTGTLLQIDTSTSQVNDVKLLDVKNINSVLTVLAKTGNTGNVGINNAAPQERLDVIGNIAATGTIKSNSHGLFTGYVEAASFDMKTPLAAFRARNADNTAYVSVFYLDSDNNVIINGSGSTPTYFGGDTIVEGHFSAVTKAFLIDHPTKEGRKLQHGAIESPEWSVVIRGKTSGDTITLPDYWTGLVHEDSVTVILTPVGKFQPLYVVSADNQKVVVGGAEGEYNYIISGERKDVAKLEVEL